MKLALLVLVAAALAAPSIAAADTPQGQLNGAANVGADAFLTTSTVLDGGMSYVGAENDLSGSCAGDSGQFLFGRPGSARLFDVVCAHYVASSKCCPAGAPKMRFASQLSDGSYAVIRITAVNNVLIGSTFASGITATLANAQAWVNKGEGGCHCGATWTYIGPVVGLMTITP